MMATSVSAGREPAGAANSEAVSAVMVSLFPVVTVV
jgi:hypothetical protein